MTYYHVWITLRSHKWPGVRKLDLSREELELRVVRPYRRHGLINLAGRRLSPDEIERVQIRTTEESAEQIKPRVLTKRRAVGVPIDYSIFTEGKDVTDEILEPLDLSSPPSETAASPVPEPVHALLQRVWDFYKANNRWPSTRQLDDALHREHRLDLPTLTAELPPGLLWPDLSHFRPGWEPDQQEVRLTIRGLSLASGTEDELRELVAVIGEVARLASEYEPQSADEYLAVSSGELAASLGLSPDSVGLKAVFDLVVAGLPGLWRGGGINPDGWSFTVNERGARRYLGVSSVADLLERIDQINQAQQAELAQLNRLFPAQLGTAEHSSTVDEEPTKSPAALPVDDLVGDPDKVFVVHGRNQEATAALKEFLTSLGLHIVDFEFDAIAATGSGAPYTGDILTAAFHLARAVIVFLTPDEKVQLRPVHAASPSELREEYQARPNVYFEAGMAFLSHPQRTVIVELGNTRPFSDIIGRHTIRLDDSWETREKLISRLRVAGCEVEPKDDRWRSAGEFMASVEFPVEGDDSPPTGASSTTESDL